MIGTKLGHYRILERIGAGGMGVVFRARDERLARDVAVKVLSEGLLANASARARFRKEALALSRLNHPNVATIFDFDSEAGVDFLVMELIAGRTLEERLEEGALPEAEVLRLGVELSRGLEAAHGQGIVHRDLKPSNIRILPDGRLKILDFGLARVHAAPGDASIALTASQEILGTLRYMAPEQIRGENVDARADIHAAGAILYEMATGRRAFPGSHPAELVYAIVNEVPAPPRECNPAVSPELDAVIRKALEKDPAERYSSSADLGADLDRIRSGQAVPVRPIGGARAGRRPRAGRVPFRWLVSGLAGLVLFSVAALLSGRMPWIPHGVSGPISALAVLPLENFSRDPDQEYFADGMTDQLITDLAQIGALRVISRTSVMRYKGSTKGLSQIAHELNVDAVVEGTVQRAGERVRITAQLVQASTDKNLWAESFERDLVGVLTLQSEVARAIAERIRVRLKPDEITRLATARTVNPEAYQACLKGRYSWNKFTETGFNQAEEFFNRAIAIDSAYAPAWAGLADTYYGRSNLYLPPNIAIPRARAAAEKALALDPSLAAAHTSLGIVKTVYDWDWAGAEREFLRAIELTPGDAYPHLWYGRLLVALGRADEGIAESERALSLDPQSSFVFANVGCHCFYARRYDRAAEVLQKTLDMDSEAYLALGFLGEVRAAQGRNREAIENLEAENRMNDNPDGMAQLGFAYARGGKPDAARTILRKVLDRSKRQFVPAADLAVLFTGLGEKEDALTWLSRAFEDHSEALMFLGRDPLLDDLRADPRFPALERRLGLPKRSGPS